MSSFPKFRGFTLIEVLVAVAVIAILAALAFPSFQDSIRKSRRADALQALLGMQVNEEKFRAKGTTYANSAAYVLAFGPLPTSDYYAFAVDAANNTSYAVSATATIGKGQEKDQQNGTPCSPLRLNQNGDQEPADCWQK